MTASHRFIKMAGSRFVILGFSLLLYLFAPQYWPFLALVAGVFVVYGDVVFERLSLFIKRDLRAATGAGAVAIMAQIRSWDDKSISDLFEQTVRRNPKKTFFIYQQKSWTFEEIDCFANQIANYFFVHHELKKGDCVALVAPSSPQYVAIWLGLNKIGCITALVNCNLKGDPLLHAIKESKANIAIVGADILDAYLVIKTNLPNVTAHLLLENENDMDQRSLPEGFLSLEKEISRMPTAKMAELKSCGYFDRIVYIYTSGTTGLPKPCIITCHRMFAYIASHHYFAGVRSDDVLYCTLPLYHSAGGLIAVGQGIVYGTTIFLRKNFSASRFWDEVIANRCTVFHYVGELCRYLLSQPRKPTDTTHTLRLMYGVGLRPQVWKEFVERFKVRRIVETYGSTEGNAALANVDSKPGAIGYISWFLETFKQQWLIKVDAETGEPVKDARGFCVTCKAEEPGELIGRIASGSKFSQFDGYVQKEATEKKYLRNVFRKGDLFFRTGDVMVTDRQGYVYFVDRTGDTFRWKGENVSTNEVEGVLSKLLSEVDVAVYGVTVPGCEGKAGMACIAADPAEVNMSKLVKGLADHLPPYARPLFLRFTAKIAMTETFKIQKVAYREEAFDPKKVGRDRLYFFNPKTITYEELTTDTLRSITDGNIKY